MDAQPRHGDAVASVCVMYSRAIRICQWPSESPIGGPILVEAKVGLVKDVW